MAKASSQKISRDEMGGKGRLGVSLKVKKRREGSVLLNRDVRTNPAQSDDASSMEENTLIRLCRVTNVLGVVGGKGDREINLLSWRRAKSATEVWRGEAIGGARRNVRHKERRTGPSLELPASFRDGESVGGSRSTCLEI